MDLGPFMQGLFRKKFPNPKNTQKAQRFRVSKTLSAEIFIANNIPSFLYNQKALPNCCIFHHANLQVLCLLPLLQASHMKSSKHSALGLKRETFCQTKCCFVNPTRNPPCSSFNQA